MGLQLTVSGPEGVFTSVHARKLATVVARKYPGFLASPTPRKPWRSEEVPWSGWAALQSSVAASIGKRKPFHLGSVEAWCGVFLPTDIKPAKLKILGGDTPLQVASTVHLDKELREYARRLRLPTNDVQLRARFEQYLDDDEETVTTDHIPTYLQLMQGVNKSLSRKQPLWVVK